MKIFYTMSLIFCLSVTFVSCSEDNDTQDLENEVNLTANSSSRAMEFDYYSATRALINDVDNGYEYEFPLSQQDLDRLKDITGIHEDVDLEGVNTIVGEVSSAHSMGYERYMTDKMDIKEFTKETVLTIAASGPMEGVERTGEFKSLPRVEKRMIMTANDIAQNWKDNGGKQRGVIDGIFSSIAGGGVGTYIGMSIGGFFGGPLGATIGGWIGGVVGGFVGWVFGSSK